MYTHFNNILALLALLVLCYTQAGNAAPIQSQQNADNNLVTRACDKHNEEHAATTLQARTNLMPGISHLLPVLTAFGNVGQSGHKEGGKAPVAN